MADARNLFILLETAAGYALFEVVAFEEIGSLLDGDTVTDLTRFGRAIKLKAFHPFETAQEALENANAIAEHTMTDTLSSFLEMNLPLKKGSSSSSSDKSLWALGVIDPALATSIQEGLGKQHHSNMACRSDDTVREIVRGCRLHLTTFVKGLDGMGQKAQLGLGHSYSRSKVKFNPARSDNMIIQSIALLDQMDKDLNTFAMRIREWYSWHFPELKDLVKDNIIFARTAALIQDRASLKDESKLDALTEVTGDEEIAKAIVAASKTSMGMDCSTIDMINIINFTQRMVKLAEYRKQLSLYLTNKMSIVAPNLSALIGDTVAARLISKAGSLTNLAKAPASTVQILGAEKALFRALKTKGNTPKYGLIYHSTFIGRADSKNKGRISRYLANKCAIATRIDTFSEEPSRLYGEKLRDQVEERLKFYETGAAPRRNVDVMEEVAKELKAGRAPPSSSSKKADAMDIDDDDEDEKKSAKKKKKDKKRKSVESTDAPATEEKKSAKKDKKRKADNDDDDNADENVEEKHSSKKKKKDKKEAATTPASKIADDDEELYTSEKKKKKSRKEKEDVVETPKTDAEDVTKSSEKKKKSDKKKKKKSNKDDE